MKIRIGLLLALVLLCLAVLASASVAVDEEHFPDKNFRSYIEKKYGIILSDEEINGITSLYIDGLQISDLTGLEYFTELRTLDCDYNPVGSIDISQITHLSCLSCVKTNIFTLDVSQCPALVRLVKEYKRESVSTQSG